MSNNNALANATIPNDATGPSGSGGVPKLGIVSSPSSGNGIEFNYGGVGKANQSPSANNSAMMTMGSDLMPDSGASAGGSGARRSSVISRRNRKGECPTCGMKTHKIGLFGKKTELTIEGYVYRGQCLHCHPIEGYQGTKKSSGGRRTGRPSQTDTNISSLNQLPRQNSQKQQILHQMPPHPSQSQTHQQQHHKVHPQHQPSSQMPTMHRQYNAVPPHLLQHPQHTMTTSPHPAYPQAAYLAQHPAMLAAPSANMVIPRTLDLGNDYDDDGLSVVSGITMDMRLIQGARNWDGKTTYDEEDAGVGSDEDDARAPPITGGRRPGADADTYERPAGVTASGGAIGFMPSRRANSHGRGGNGFGGGNDFMHEQHMPQIQETGGYAGYGPNSGAVAPGLDADGYPIAGATYGWDKSSDILPPGQTMDSLLQSTTTKKKTKKSSRPVTSSKPLRTTSNNEIVLDSSNGEIVFDAATQQQQVPKVGVLRDSSPRIPASHRQRAGSRSPTRSRSPKPPGREMNNIRPTPFMPNSSNIPARMSDPFGADDDDDEEDADPHSYMIPQPMQSVPGLYGNASIPTADPDNLGPPSHGLMPSISGTYPLAHGSPSSAAMHLKHAQSSPYGAGGKDPALTIPPRLSISQSSGFDTVSTFGAPPKDRWANPGAPKLNNVMSGSNSDLPPMPASRRSLIQQQLPGPLLSRQDSAAIAAAYAEQADDEIESQEENGGGAHQYHLPQHHRATSNSHTLGNSGGGGKPAAYDSRQVAHVQPTKTMSHFSLSSTATPPLRRTDLRGRPDDNVRIDPTLGGSGAMEDLPLANAALSGIPASAMPPLDEKSVRDMARRLSSLEFDVSHKSDNNNQHATSDDKNGNNKTDDADEQNTADDIPAILQCVNLEDAEPYLRDKAFSSLTQIVWRLGEPAKRKIVEYQGVDTLVNAIWSDIGNANVQAAAANLLLAIAASNDGNPASDVLSSESVCDALLFSMRTHERNEGIQLTGCCILACLAAASGTNRAVTDGTLSGAVTMVVDSMFLHRQSVVIQKAGMQALYNQCVLSNNSEGNKRSLLGAKVDNGSHSGIDVIVSAMDTLRQELISLELACKLCWCLGSNEDLCKSLSASPTILHQVVQTAQAYHVNAEAGALYEAIFGMLGNMAHLEQNRSVIQEVGAIPFILDGMRFHRNDEFVNLEACSAIANLANTRPIRDSIVKAGGVGAVIRAMQAFMDDVEVVEEAIRALVCIAIDSSETKEILAMPQVVQSISRASETHEISAAIQEMCSCLIASLIMNPGAQEAVLDNGGVDVVLRALGSSPDEKVHAAACVAFRNLACQIEDSDILLRSRSIRMLIKVMETHEKSVTVQLNACAALWHLAHKTNKEPGNIVDQQGVRCIVKAMQTHMESGELLETACGALWSLVDESIDRKKDVVASGAIDAVACALVMHPDRTGTLEKACGVLSNVSEGPLAEAIANAQGASIVVEAMRSNFQCIPLLETGCTVLRNILVQFPDFASEAEGAISTIINAMRDNPEAVNFQTEACSALWVMAAQSENCQSKILALDGVTVLMKSLDHNSDIPRLQEAAWGAFNQLAADNM